MRSTVSRKVSTVQRLSATTNRTRSAIARFRWTIAATRPTLQRFRATVQRLRSTVQAKRSAVHRVHRPQKQSVLSSRHFVLPQNGMPPPSTDMPGRWRGMLLRLAQSTLLRRGIHARRHKCFTGIRLRIGDTNRTSDRRPPADTPDLIYRKERMERKDAAAMEQFRAMGNSSNRWPLRTL